MHGRREGCRSLREGAGGAGRGERLERRPPRRVPAERRTVGLGAAGAKGGDAAVGLGNEEARRPTELLGWVCVTDIGAYKFRYYKLVTRC